MASDSDNSPIDIVIYLHDDSGIMFRVQDGQNAEAKFLFELLIKELGVETNDISKIREVFSLWLVSDLLELQLKPSHVPFKLVCYWEELLERYIHCSEETRQRDEAVIMLQRNVYISVETEKSITHPNLVKLLYCEAKKNINSGRYPVTRDVADNLAILQTQIMLLDNQNELVNPPSIRFFLEKAGDLLPAIYCRRNIFMNRKQNPENRLMDLYRIQSSSINDMNELSLYNKYLNVCRDIIPYGAAFFRGQAEHQGKNLDDPVWIAINFRGVAIVSIKDQAVLLAAPFENLSWQFAESTSGDVNYLPCLFLHFPITDKDVKVTKLLQVFSKSAFLADNLIETFVLLRAHSKDSSDRLIETVTADISRLALMTFDQDGMQLNSTIRLPKKSLRDSKSHPV